MITSNTLDAKMNKILQVLESKNAATYMRSDPDTDMVDLSTQTVALARKSSLQAARSSPLRRSAPELPIPDEGIKPLPRTTRGQLRRRSSATWDFDQRSPALAPWSDPSFDYTWTSTQSSITTCFMALRDFGINPRHIGQLNFNLPLPLDEIEIYSIVKLADDAEAGLFDPNTRDREENISKVEWCIDVLRSLGDRFEKEMQRRNESSAKRGGVHVLGPEDDDFRAIEYLGLVMRIDEHVCEVPSKLLEAEEENIRLLGEIYAGR